MTIPRSHFSSLRWTWAATAINFVSQFFFLGIMARLLDPADFGLMAMSTVVLRFASYFAQFGAAQALIQKPQLSPGDMASVLLMASGAGLVLYVLLWLVAPLAVVFFKNPLLADIVRVVGVNVMLMAVSSVALAYLRRHGRFAALSVIEVASYVLGFGVFGVTAALYYDQGVWSLVWASIGQASLLCVLGFLVARPRLDWRQAPHSFRHFLSHGSRQSFIGFLEFIGANLEVLYVGRAIGQYELGLYNRSQLITNLPLEQFIAALGKVFFPFFSRLQNEPAQLGQAFRAMLLGAGLIAAPFAMGVLAVAEDIVAVLLGPKWHAAVEIVRWLALAAPAYYFYFVCGMTLDSIAALRSKLRIQATVVVTKAILIVGLASQGMVGVLIAIIVAEYFRMLLGLLVCARALAIRKRELAGLVALTYAVAGGVYLALSLLHGLLLAGGIELWARVVIEFFTAIAVLLVACGVLFLFTYKATGWRDNPAYIWLFQALKRRLPNALT